jgi:signal transduction histidine kinase
MNHIKPLACLLKASCLRAVFGFRTHSIGVDARKPAIGLWQYTFLRVAVALCVLLLLVGGAGYVLVTRPALDRHAQGLTAILWPQAEVGCAGLRHGVTQLARVGLSGIDVREVPAGHVFVQGWLLPFDALLVNRMARASQLPLQARSVLATLTVRVPCAGQPMELVFDRAKVLGASPDAALGVWLLALILGAIGMAVWLVRTLSNPLQEVANHVRATPLGTAVHGVPSLSKIREVRHMQDEIDALRARVSDAVASRGALLMGLSHELRRPLTRVRLILDTAVPPLPQDVAEMRADVLELQSCLDEFMRAANAMASPVESGAAQSVWTHLQRTLNHPRLEFGNAPGFDTPPLNAAALQRVAINLLDNALRHTQGQVVVAWVSHPQGWRLCVRDRGLGMGESQWQWAQRPFNTSDVSGQTSTQSHAGLGLALARMLCEHNGWQLGMANCSRQGFRVFVQWGVCPE